MVCDSGPDFEIHATTTKFPKNDNAAIFIPGRVPLYIYSKWQLGCFAKKSGNLDDLPPTEIPDNGFVLFFELWIIFVLCRA
jgi:hypothetical protein